MRVYIKQGSTNSTAYQLDPGAVITLGGVSVGVSGNTLSVAVDADSLISGATAGNYVRTINGVQPDRNGDFLIEGSGCVSWTYTDEDIVDVTLSGDTIHGALLLADMCPSCTTCENIYKLQHDLEVMKLNINTLKDVSLYDEGTAVDNRARLSAERVTGSSSTCGVYPPDDILTTRAAWLFREYVTMLHMWNYVVSINNASTVIQLAPENTAGFVVQTKHAVTSCDGTVPVQCTIDVKKMYCVGEGNEIITEPAEYANMSVLIPDESVRYTYGPFGTVIQDVPGGQPGFNELSKPTITPISYTHKRITTTTLNAVDAGTYMLEAKFIPFVPTALIVGGTVSGTTVIGGTTVTTDNWGTIGGTTTSVPGGTSTAYDYRLATKNLAANLNPTRDEYMNSNIAPLAVADFSIVWKVETTWIIGGSTQSQTYLYRCNAIGTPCGDIITPVTIIDDRLQPEPT